MRTVRNSSRLLAGGAGGACSGGCSRVGGDGCLVPGDKLKIGVRVAERRWWSGCWIIWIRSRSRDSTPRRKVTTLGPAYNEHTASRLQWTHWVPLLASTLGPAYNEHAGSCLQWVHWVPLTMSTLGLAYNEHLGSCLQWAHWVPLTLKTLGPAYNEHTGSRLQWAHWSPLTTSSIIHANVLVISSTHCIQTF